MRARDNLGEFEQLVMLALAAGRGPASGRDVYERITSETGRDVSVAAVHITLRRLEAKELVTTSRSETRQAGRRTNLFDISAAGASVLHHTRDEYDRLWKHARSHPRMRRGEV